MSDQRELLRAIYAEIQRAARASVAGFTRGGKLDLSSPNIVGHTPPARGGTGTGAGAEPPLGTPTGDFYVLVSTAAGVRSWAQLLAGPGITIERNPTTGALVISVTESLQTLTWGGDDLTWGGDTLTWGMS